MLKKLVAYDLQQSQVPGHIYLDMVTKNVGYENQPIDLHFSETRGHNIVNDAASYSVAVARFSIDTLSLPVWIPLVQTGQPNVNLSVYSFTMTYKDFTHQQYLQFLPQDSTILAPQPPTDVQDMSSEYYFVHSFQYVVDLLNNTFKQALAGLKTKVEAGGDSLPTNTAPWFSYDPSSSELILNADENGFEETLMNPISVYMNDAMHKLISSFQTYNYSVGATNGMQYKFRIYNSHGQNRMELANDLNVLLMFQEYPCTGQWSPIESLLFTSSNLPIRKSLVPKGTIFGGGAQPGSSFSDLEIATLTDFIISQESGKESRGSIEMVPYFYRKIDLTSHSSVNAVHISVFWKDVYGNIYPIKLPSGTSATIKLVFIRRGLEA